MGDKSDFNVNSSKKVVVIGGGLSGLSAALRLLENGYGVTLIEKRPFLGGRAYSFRDGRDGVEVDNGQHVFLGCNAYYIRFLREIGAFDGTYLQEKLRTEVVLNGVSGILSSTPFLGALHLLPSFVRYPHLGLADKLLAVYGLLRVKLTDRTKRQASLDDEAFYRWLKRHRQTDRAIERLWNLFVLPALNGDVRDVSANWALMVFQEALLKRHGDAAIGLSKIGLTSLNGAPAGRRIQRKGGRLVLGKTVDSIRFETAQVSGVELSDGSKLSADAYVSALPYPVLLQVLPGPVARTPFFSGARELRSSPIVGIHLWYDRPIMDQDFVAFLDSPVQWVFNKSRLQGSNQGPGQYVCISLSGARQYIHKPKQELEELFTEEMARLFPRAKRARVERCRVIKEPQATFNAAPGSALHRLPQVTPIPNLFLAGEWTDTGWPSTMEGAVRSGVLAAESLASRIVQNPV